MPKIDDKQFEKLVEEGIKAIPKKFLKRLKNVDICIEERPNDFQLEKLKIGKGQLIFGLYEGVPQIKRGSYAQNLPDKITIFKSPIEKVCHSKEKIKELVRDTVWHEIAHHFGLTESEVRKAEEKRARNKIKNSH